MTEREPTPMQESDSSDEPGTDTEFDSVNAHVELSQIAASIAKFCQNKKTFEWARNEMLRILSVVQEEAASELVAKANGKNL